MGSKLHRDTLKEIEQSLANIPTINGCEILHTHTRRGEIIFTAWKGNRQHTNWELRINRWEVWRWGKEFYTTYQNELARLTEVE